MISIQLAREGERETAYTNAHMYRAGTKPRR